MAVTTITAASFNIPSELEVVGSTLRPKLRPTEADEVLRSSMIEGTDPEQGVSVWDSLTGTHTAPYYVLSGTTQVLRSSTVGANVGQQVTFKMKWRPDFDPTANANNRYIIHLHLHQPAGSNAGAINLLYSSSNQWVLQVYNSAGTSVLNQVLIVPAITQGTEYDLEVSVDADTGDIRFFFDGILQQYSIAPFTRTVSSVRFHIGNVYNSNQRSDFSVRFIEVYNTVQNTADFTPATGFDRFYSGTFKAIATPVVTDFINSLSENTSEPLQYGINFAGNDRYRDGSSWAISDGSYAQSTNIADYNANGTGFPISGGTVLTYSVFIVSDGINPQTLDSFTIDYDFFGVQQNVQTIEGWGYVYDNDDVVEGAKVKVFTKRPTVAFGTMVSINEEQLTTDQGYFEFELLSDGNVEVVLLIEYTDANGNTQTLKRELTVPTGTDFNMLEA